MNSGVDRSSCYAASQLFAVSMAAGRPRTATRWAREVITVARSAQHLSFVSVGMSNLACALAVVGDTAGARDTLGNRLLAAETLLVAAQAARRKGSARRATALTSQAAGLTAGCQGAKTPDLRSGDQVDPLSPREREVAALAARGLRSREIADSLVVSIRTVDNHVQAIYGKLGIAGRRELASALRVN